jgi:hypothetical protein
VVHFTLQIEKHRALCRGFKNIVHFAQAFAAFAEPAALSLKISAERRIIGVTGTIREFRNAETGCEQRILARPNGVARQTPFFRQVYFQSRSRKMDRTTSLANRATSEARCHFAKQIERPLNDRPAQS